MLLAQNFIAVSFRIILAVFVSSSKQQYITLDK